MTSSVAAATMQLIRILEDFELQPLGHEDDEFLCGFDYYGIPTL
jgi:hypothetical protein